MAAIKLTIEDDYITLYGLFKKGKLDLKIYFVIHENYDFEKFVFSEKPLCDDSGECNGSNWSLQMIGTKCVYTLGSNCGGTPYLVYKFNHDDEFITDFIKKAREGLAILRNRAPE